MKQPDRIRIATWEDEPKIGALMALAFANDPFVRWILPDPYDYLRDSEDHVGKSSGPAFDHGSAYIIGDFSGAAIWLPPNMKLSREHDVGGLLKKSGPPKPEEFAALIEKSAAYCPPGPHWYLAFIVVDPAKSGSGLGSTLLQHTLAICDRDGLPTYLESTNASNLTLYKRHGFEILAEVRVGKSPARYPMLRQSVPSQK